MSGTSMASPHVAGVAALYLSRFTAATAPTAAAVEAVLKSDSAPTGTTGKGGFEIKIVQAGGY